MRSPFVAIITRTKNRPLLLERAMKSILGQSFEDFVSVIINDGGEPETVNALVKKYKDNFKDRIQVIHNSKSVGMEAASNIGIKKSSSKYIALLDDDDTWHKDFLKETVNYLEESNCYGVVTASEVVKEVVSNDKIEILGKERFSPEINNFTLFSLSGVNQFPNNSFVYARKVLETVGLYNEATPVLGDWDFNTRFLLNYDIAFINEPLAYYHQRQTTNNSLNNSMSNNGHREYTAHFLNHQLRTELEAGKLGIGFIANLSHQMQIYFVKNRSNHDQLLHHIDSVQASIGVLNDQLQEIQKKLNKIQNHSVTRRLVNYSKKKSFGKGK